MSDEIKLTEKQRHLIEKVGVAHEKSGMPPAPARILGLLLVSPVLELTFDQIRATLNLSKSATSNALNMLLNGERIDYITHPGERKRYFKNRITSWKMIFQGAVNGMTRMADIFEEILEARTKDTVAFNESMAEIVEFMRFVKEDMPLMYERWENQKNAK